MSQESCDAIYEVLKSQYSTVGVSIVDNVRDLRRVVAKRPDLVFLGMKFVPENPAHGPRHPARVWVADYLEAHDIATTGSDYTAHRLEFNKPLAKQRVQDAGLRTSPFIVTPKGAAPYFTAGLPLRFPLFVKPATLGGGQGINEQSVVHNLFDLHAKVESIITRRSTDVLIEEYLPGREFSIAVLKDEHSDQFFTMPIELVAPKNARGNRILSQEVKSSDQEVVLPVTDVAIRARITTLALRAFKALGARDYGRIDIRLDSTGAPHFLEANLIPSLIDGYGSFPKACVLNIGMDYRTMILTITRLGLARSPISFAQQTEPALTTLFSPPAATIG